MENPRNLSRGSYPVLQESLAADAILTHIHNITRGVIHRRCPHPAHLSGIADRRRIGGDRHSMPVMMAGVMDMMAVSDMAGGPHDHALFVTGIALVVGIRLPLVQHFLPRGAISFGAGIVSGIAIARTGIRRFRSKKHCGNGKHRSCKHMFHANLPDLVDTVVHQGAIEINQCCII